MDTEVKVFFEAFEQRLNGRFDRIEQRLDAHDRQFEAINARLDGHDRRFESLDLRFQSIDSRFDRLERNQNDMQEQIAFLIDRFGKFADDATKKVQSHEFRLTSLESRVQLA
jgi:chromosome segregation ATPase